MRPQASRVAKTKGRFALLAVLEDHRVRALADRGDLPYAGRLNSLDAYRPGWKQPTEQHPLLAEPDTNGLVPVPRLERLPPVQGDVVREHDLAIVTPDDPLATTQLNQDGSHDSIVTSRTTQSRATTPKRQLGLRWIASAQMAIQF